MSREYDWGPPRVLADKPAGNNGGPAFPPTHDPSTHPSGMSLRDWFAGQVMVEMIRLSMDADGGWSDDTVAYGCYRLADAMLASTLVGIGSRGTTINPFWRKWRTTQAAETREPDWINNQSSVAKFFAPG